MYESTLQQLLWCEPEWEGQGKPTAPRPSSTHRDKPYTPCSLTAHPYNESNLHKAVTSHPRDLFETAKPKKILFFFFKKWGTLAGVTCAAILPKACVMPCTVPGMQGSSLCSLPCFTLQDTLSAGLNEALELPLKGAIAATCALPKWRSWFRENPHANLTSSTTNKKKRGASKGDKLISD